MVYGLSQVYGGSAGGSSWSNANFDWGPGMRDSSSGFAYFPTYADATQGGIYQASFGGFGIDARSILNAQANNGRASTNITSRQAFRHGLFVVDMHHMPSGNCGTWPSIALVSSTVGYSNKMYLLNYYNNEKYNRYQVNSNTTACTPPQNANSYTGVQPSDYSYSNCFNPDPNATPSGCVYYSSPNDTTAVATPFNSDVNGGGGFYALEWTSNRIAMWHFTRSNAPSDIAASSPDPTRWPTPALLMNKNDGCDPDVAFPDPMRIQILIRYCGLGAGNTYVSDGCGNGNQDCPSRVALMQSTPDNYQGDYYAFNAISVYQDPNDGVAASEPMCPVPVPDPYFGGPANPSLPLGCYNDLNSFTGFTKTQSIANMTAAQCVGICGSQAYSAVSGNDCYCSSNIAKTS